MFILLFTPSQLITYCIFMILHNIEICSEFRAIVVIYKLLYREIFEIIERKMKVN